MSGRRESKELWRQSAKINGNSSLCEQHHGSVTCRPLGDVGFVSAARGMARRGGSQACLRLGNERRDRWQRLCVRPGRLCTQARSSDCYNAHHFVNGVARGSTLVGGVLYVWGLLLYLFGRVNNGRLCQHRATTSTRLLHSPSPCLLLAVPKSGGHWSLGTYSQ